MERAAPVFAGEARHYTEAAVRPDDVLVYHAAHASALGEWLAGVEAVKVIDYHGITPPEFLRAWQPGLAVALARGRAELAALGPGTALGVAHSEFTRRELVAMGFRDTAALPILMDAHRLAAAPDPVLLDTLAAGNRGHDWLFVSRLAPNKRVEDLIKAFCVYRRAWCPAARLFVVGRPDIPRYARALELFVERLGIEEVHLMGSVPVDDLAAYYATADVFVCLSEHEGFGVPCLEAMSCGVPVVAFAAGGLPETVGDGAVVIADKAPEQVAAVVGEVLGDPDLRARLAAAGRGRLAVFAPDIVGRAWVELLGGLG
ncbi:MAG TPA: glycosyltransferase family 4 protein [Actinomycetota bacterium]|nr:glycosyltransferase family 4 protein [Actinomycetota bacterium]